MGLFLLGLLAGVVLAGVVVWGVMGAVTADAEQRQGGEGWGE